MSRGSGSSVIPVAVFLAILLIVLPVSADHITRYQTTVTTTQTHVTTSPTAVVTTIQPTVSATETITTGSVNVYFYPTGASILIDGLYSGTTPKTVNGVAAGNRILRLELSGSYDYESSIYVVAGQTAEGYGTLQPMNQVTSAVPIPTVIIPVMPLLSRPPLNLHRTRDCLETRLFSLRLSALLPY